MMGIPKETIPLCHQAGPMGQGWAPISLQPPCDLCMVLMGLWVSERCTSPTGYGVRGPVAPEVRVVGVGGREGSSLGAQAVYQHVSPCRGLGSVPCLPMHLSIHVMLLKGVLPDQTHARLLTPHGPISVMEPKQKGLANPT